MLSINLGVAFILGTPDIRLISLVEKKEGRRQLSWTLEKARGRFTSFDIKGE